MPVATGQSNFQLYLNPKTFRLWPPKLVVVVTSLGDLQFLPLSAENVHKFATAIWLATCNNEQKKLPQAAANLCGVNLSVVSRNPESSSFEGHTAHVAATFRAGCKQIRVGVECLIMGVIMCHWYASKAWQTSKREREREGGRSCWGEVRHSRRKLGAWNQLSGTSQLAWNGQDSKKEIRKRHERGLISWR